MTVMNKNSTVTGTNVTQATHTSKSVTLSDPKSVAPDTLSLDTLAQLSTYTNETAILDDRLLRRARSKWMTSPIALPLADLRTELEKYYRRAYYCCHELIQQGQTVTGKYCNSRICYTCNRIRTAKLINGYKKPIGDMSQPMLVTLTRKNVTGDQLSVTLTEMCHQFRKILLRNAARKRYGNALPCYGIRKIEVTYNANRNTFHPHFHIVTDGRNVSERIVTDWLEFSNGNALRQAQDIRPVTDDSLLEVFKYATKIVTNGKRVVPLDALDVIMQALYGRRITQPFGSMRIVSEEVEGLQSDSYPGLPEYELMQWGWHEHDWINGYGECMTGYTPPVDK